MPLYDRVLVPTDGSVGVDRAVAHAVDLAVAHGAEIHAVYVVNTVGLVGLPMDASLEGLDEMLRSDADHALERVREAAEGADVAVTTHVIEGSPSTEIVRFAEREGCDLIVMGTHGRGGIDRLLLGSVTEKVVRASNVPVLTLRVGNEPPGEPT
jgi:nucleotide-binding universal stress UspA family protein